MQGFAKTTNFGLESLSVGIEISIERFDMALHMNGTGSRTLLTASDLLSPPVTWCMGH